MTASNQTYYILIYKESNQNLVKGGLYNTHIYLKEEQSANGNEKVGPLLPQGGMGRL